MCRVDYNRNRITDHYIFLTLAVIFFGACTPWSTDRSTDNREPDYELVQDIVVDVWKERFDYITNGSAKALKTYTLREVEYSELKECKHAQGVRPIGCYKCAGDKVLIDHALPAIEKECVFAHELGHLLSFHEFGDIQSDHSDPALWDEFGDDTIESVVCKMLREVI